MMGRDRPPIVASCAALALSACAFSSEQALFDAAEGATPFADGARFLWLEDEGREQQQVLYRRVEAGYEIAPPDRSEEPMRVVFIAMPDTPEDDYIAQVALAQGEPGRAYAFVWRTQAAWRIVTAPSAFAETSPGQGFLSTLCAARPNGECQFARREDVLAFYRDAVRPMFVAGAETPEDFMDQIPVADQEAE